MINKIAKFEKVSFEQFLKDVKEKEIAKYFIRSELKEIYDNIELPTRATKGSAGFDIKTPFETILNSGETVVVPTGIRCKMEEGWVLIIAPRSGHGFKFRIQLDNTIGVIDQDYYYSDNEGHIMVKLTNDSKCASTCNIKKYTGMAQGLFLPFGVTFDDNVEEVRNGGFGSTTK